MVDKIVTKEVQVPGPIEYVTIPGPTQYVDRVVEKRVEVPYQVPGPI